MRQCFKSSSVGPAGVDLQGNVRTAGRLVESIVDGPGLRYVLFTQGCPHQCPGCHNPETHDFQGGRDIPLNIVYGEIRRNPILRGVTFSGGEPLCRWQQLLPLAAVLKNDGYHLMAYTGYTLEYLLDSGLARPFLECLDVLVDGPFLLAERSLELRFRGSRNQRILDMPASLATGRAVLHTLQHG